MRHLCLLALIPLHTGCSQAPAHEQPPLEPASVDIDPLAAGAQARAQGGAAASGAMVKAEDAAPAVMRERPWPVLAAIGEQGHAEAPAARVYSKVRFLWIRPTPSDAREWIGYLSLGDSVPLRGGSAESAAAGPGSGEGCSRWYAVQPRGYVCVGDDATLDGEDADVIELQKGVAKPEPWPYDYSKSLGTTVYLNIPPKRRQYFRESAYREHMEAVGRARQVTSDEEVAAIDPKLVGVDLQPSGNPAPKLLLHLGARAMPRASAGKYGFPEVVGGSTIATYYDFDADERSWLMTWDRGIVPKDRVRPYPRSEFHGLPLGDGVELPLAFFRQEQPKLRRGSDSVSETGERWPRYAWVGLTGEELKIGGERYLVTREQGLLCPASSVSAPRLRQDLPKRMRAKGERDSAEQGSWVDISIVGGWLVAYEGSKPVYTTMVSPGRGGLPETGKTLLETASTPVGDFVLGGKFHTATMVSNYSEKVVHAEVPYTQNFSGPYALHAAYWHDDWGVGKSGGCVNLAPIDGMRLFSWTRPRLPEGWHGWRAAGGDDGGDGPVTVVSVHR